VIYAAPRLGSTRWARRSMSPPHLWGGPPYSV
jgi:hypothetical protein